jgi:ribosomal protein S27E
MGLFYSGNSEKILKLVQDKNKLKHETIHFSDSNVIAEFVLKKEYRKDFVLKKDSPTGGISTLVCKICGNDKFIVGQAEFFTAIKCDTCGYELGIHEG